MDRPGTRLCATYDDTPREAPRPAPLFKPVIALMLGIWLSDSWGLACVHWRLFAVLAPILVLALLIVARRWPIPQNRLAFLVLFAAAATGFARHQTALDLPPHHLRHVVGRDPVLTRLAGAVVTPPVERPSQKRNEFLPFDPPPQTCFLLAADELRTTDPPKPTAGYVRVAVAALGLELQLGERVVVAGRLHGPSSPANPGAMDWERWNRQQGIDAGLSVESAAHIERSPADPSTWYRLVAAARAAARSLLFEPQTTIEADESSQLLDTMVLGQRRSVDQKLNEAFLRCGGMHFLAVSGFNIAVLATVSWWVVRRILRQGRRAAALTTLVFSMAYALVAEPNAPILRATVGIVLVVCANLTNRPQAVLNWLALAAGSVLVWNPNELFGAGFQLSFVQVLALMTVIRWIGRIVFFHERTEPLTVAGFLLDQVRTGLLGLTLVCVGAWVIAIPLTLWHFGQWAPWGGLGAILLTPFVTLITVLSLITMAANALLPPLGSALGGLLHAATAGLLWAVELFEHLPCTVVECQRPPSWLVLATYLVPAVLYRWRAVPHPRGRPAPFAPSRTLLIGVAAAGLALAWGGWTVLPSRALSTDYALHILAVGNGSAAVLVTPERDAVVFDAGTDGNFDVGDTVARALGALGVRRVKGLLLSHAHSDHGSGVPTLVARWPADRWWTHPQFFEARDGDGIARALTGRLPAGTPAPDPLRAGDELDFGAVRVEVLWPPEELPADLKLNETSLVVRICVGGRRILLASDIERAALAALADAARVAALDLRADVLVAPHHGQVVDALDASENFYAAVSPSVVVASTRSTRPKLAALLERQNLGIRLWQTGELGAVAINVAPDGRLSVAAPYAAPP